MKTRTGTASLALAAVTGVIAFVLFLAGGALLWANGHYKDADGFWSTGSARLTTDTRALTTDDLDVGRLARDRYGTLRVNARSTGEPLFVGVARTRDVDAYLRGVARERVRDIQFSPLRATTSVARGPRDPGRPASAAIWAASGTDVLKWRVQRGDWSVVVMNADGSAGVDAVVSAGATVPALLSLAWALLGLGLAFVLATATLTLLGTRPAPRLAPA